MSRGIYVALSGAVAQQTALDTTAANLANASSDGYVKTRVVFREVLAKAAKNGAGHYSGVAESALDSAPGNVRTTGRALDLSLPKDGFLAVGTDRGERYTRAAGLVVKPTGALETAHGGVCLDEKGKPIKVSANGGDVTVTAAGEVMQGGVTVARLKLVSFTQPERLTHEGGTLLAATPASGAATIKPMEVTSGALEESNADVTASMTEIVSASRSFEAYEKAIDAFREIDRRLVTTVPNV